MESPACTTRTVWPYFSPNSAIAPFFLCLVDAHFLGDDRAAGQNRIVYHILDLSQLLSGQRCKVGEVEADMIVCSVGACLLNMVAEHGAERLLEQVGGGMSTANSLAVSRINRSRNLVLNGQLALGDNADVHILAVLGLLNIGNGHCAVLAGDNAVVTDLTAHLRVERGAVEYNGDLLTLGSCAGNLALVYDGKDLCGLLKGWCSRRMRS